MQLFYCNVVFLFGVATHAMCLTAQVQKVFPRCDVLAVHKPFSVAIKTLQLYTTDPCVPSTQTAQGYDLDVLPVNTGIYSTEAFDHIEGD